MIGIVAKIVRKILSYINKLLPKYNQVAIRGVPNTESSAISIANYISTHYDFPVYYLISSKHKDEANNLLSSDIIIIDLYGGNWDSVNYFMKYLTSKYIFSHMVV